MARILTASAIVLALRLLVAPAATPASRWTGWITDDHCGAKGAKPSHTACAQKCVEQGSKLILYCDADRKLYTLDRQDLAKQHLGHAVAVTGTLEGNSISVTSIEMLVTSDP